MTQRYDLRNVRAFLSKRFTDEELRRLCYDAPGFERVYRQLRPSSSKAEVIRLLVEYAERTSQMEALLNLAKEHNPARYEERQTYYADGAGLTIATDGGGSSPKVLAQGLAKAYGKLLDKYRRNLLEIDIAMAEFIDQRTVPPDLLHARNGILQKMAELEGMCLRGR